MVEALTAIRHMTSTRLPIGNSTLPYDILLVVLRQKPSDEKLTVKRLLASLPHSATGIRYHFDHLREGGWIKLTPDKIDARVKVVIPTKKLMREFDSLCRNLMPIFETAALPGKRVSWPAQPLA